MRTDTRTLEEKIADRNAKLDAPHDKLSSAVEQLVTGKDRLRALAFAARLRACSLDDTLLIQIRHALAHAQGLVPNPDPTYVAGFEQLTGLGPTCPQRPARLPDLRLVTARMATCDPETGPWRRLAHENPESGEPVRPRVIGVRPGYVWDVSRSDGKPLPEPPSP
jgi:hypothetical protein